MSIKPSGYGHVPSLSPRDYFLIDLNQSRTESGVQDSYKRSESVVSRAMENPAEHVADLLPEHVATAGLRFVLSETGENGNKEWVSGYFEGRNGGIRYVLDDDRTPDKTFDNTRVIDEVQLEIKRPGAIKKSFMKMLGKQAMAKVRYSREDGVPIGYVDKVAKLTESLPTDESELEFWQEPEYLRIRLQNEAIAELEQDLNPGKQTFKMAQDVKEADLDFVPIVPEKGWVNDVYAFLRESDKNDPMALLRQDWNEEEQGFNYDDNQRQVFGQLAQEMDKEAVDLFVHGHEALAQLADEMDPIAVNDFIRLKSNDKLAQNQDANRHDDDDDDYHLSAIL